MMELRRIGPRIGIDAMCWEMLDSGDVTATSVDLSAGGICIERPYVGGPILREMPLQIEVPGIDEVMWAKGEIAFDSLVQTAPHGRGGPLGLIRRTGYRIAQAATRDLRMLKEFVFETYRDSRPLIDIRQLSLELGPAGPARGYLS